MSIERCMVHDRDWDGDFMDACPSCPSGSSRHCLRDPLHFIQGFGRRCHHCKTQTGTPWGRRWTVDEREWRSAADNCEGQS